LLDLVEPVEPVELVEPLSSMNIIAPNPTYELRKTVFQPAEREGKKMEIEREIERIKYPHMVPQEVEIWKRFLKKYGEKFTGFRYDVHVGEGIGRIPGIGKNYQDMAIMLSQKRIDVVGSRAGDIYIIEIKERAGMSAIGQLIAYRKLYEDKYGVGEVEGLICVAESTDQDFIRASDPLGIQLVLV